MPNFIYENNIPAASHNPSADQPIMQTNTNSINSIIGVDHFSFNTANGGYHKQVSLVNEATPALPSGVGCMLLSGSNNLIFANAQIPTGVFLTQSNAPPVVAIKGSTFLPGAIVMQWGQGTTTGGIFNDTYIYPMTTTFVIFSGVQGFTGEVITNASILTLGPPPFSNVTVGAKFANGSPVPNGTIVYWMAIGIL